MSLNEQTGRRVLELTRPECWKLLASVPLGRVVFSQRAMPAVHVADHLVEDGVIIVRSSLGAVITDNTVLPGHGPGGRATGARAARGGATARAAHGRADHGGAVVCYEADELDPARKTGWSVMVTGLARRVHDPASVARYSRLLSGRAVGASGDVLVVEPGIITGRRVVP